MLQSISHFNIISEFGDKPLKKPVIGVLQLLPLPGSPQWQGNLQAVIDRAEQEASAMVSSGIDTILLENTNDAPYASDRVDPAAIIAIAQVIQRIKQFSQISVGISVLANDPLSALAIAVNTKAQFIRVPVLVGTRVTEGGMLPGKITELTAYYQQLKAEHPIEIWADVTMNHIVPVPQLKAPWQAPQGYLKQVIATVQKQHGITGIIVNQAELSPEQLAELKEETTLPVWVGEQFDTDSISPFYQAADGLILKHNIQKTVVTTERPTVTQPTVDPYKLEILLSQLK